MAGLRAQPAGFWLGVGLVAEAPAALTAALLPDGVRQQVAASVFTSPAWAVIALAVCLLLYAGTAWVALRLGFGE